MEDLINLVLELLNAKNGYKKFINKNVFTVKTKNANWKILINNLAAFKKRDEFKDEKFCYYSGSLKNPIFRGNGRGGGGVGGSEKNNIGGNCLKSGGNWTVCRFKRGLVILRGLLPSTHYKQFQM